MLLEGSQGTLLDVDHGTYPYVTSSNPTAGGGRRLRDRAHPHHHGAGHPQGLYHPGGLGSVPHRVVRRARRVPGQDRGGEVGVTTGRARRCGWFDSVIARYATRVNGITDYFLTKLDVLSSLESVPVSWATRSTANAPTRCR